MVKKTKNKKIKYPSRLHTYWVAFLIWFFPPYAWHNMWVHKKYHSWFPIVSWINSATISLPAGLYLFVTYPQMISAGKTPIISLGLAYFFIALAFFHIFYGLFLKKAININGRLPESLLWPTVLLFFLDYVIAFIITPIALPFLNSPIYDLINTVMR